MSLADSPVPPRRLERPLIGYGLAVVMTAVATGVALLVDQAAPAPNLSLIFVLPVVMSAIGFGLGPALSAAALAALAYNFFLIAPRYTLRVADPANLWALGLLTLVAVAVSAVAAASRQRAIEAQRAAEQAAAVHGLARDLVAETDRAALADRSAQALADLFGAPAAVLLQEPDGGLSVHPAGGAAPAEADLEAARWSLTSGVATRGGAYPAGEAAFDIWPLKTAQRQRAALALKISGADAGRPAQPERWVETVGGYLAVALDREAYARQALERRVRSAGEKLKADLLAAVSHDLRTPLSTILFVLQSLQRFDTTHDAGARARLLGSAETETRRLSRMVENLLDMSRLEAGAVVPRAESSDLADLAAAALLRAGPTLDGRTLVNDVAAGVTVLVDAGLFETALANVLDNAAKYSPPDAPIRLVAGVDAGMGWLEVIDEGAGFEGRGEALFERFVRGREGDGRPPGVGLGLSIARDFLEAMQGRVEATDRADRTGARVRLSAPLAATP